MDRVLPNAAPDNINQNGICYKVLPEYNLLSATVVGEISFAQMYQYWQALGRDPLIRPGMNSLYDMTRCANISGNLDDLSSFTHALSAYSDAWPKCKTALVLPDDNTKLLQLVQGIVMMTSASRIEHRYFFARDVDMAFRFIGMESRHEAHSAAIVDK